MMRAVRALRFTFAMDVRELSASRSYWLMLLAISALVGQAFLSATEFYAEASGAGGGPAALSQGLNPLEGILVPTFGAYDLAATLLFPFVVIHLLSHERESGAHWLTLQSPVPFGATIACKGITLLLAWMVALLPGATALMLWHVAGGHLYSPETLGLLFGYVVRGALTIGVGAVASALAASASSAAVIALAFTIGTWALDYLAAARGGMVAQIATYTPWASLRTFERGELRVATIATLLIASTAGLAFNGVMAASGRTTRSRMTRAALVVMVGIVLCVVSSESGASKDVSETRRNSFSLADERVLGTITEPLLITAHLAAEDPRLTDLERGVFAKLRRTVPAVRIAYAAGGRSELFQQNDAHYGEVWYALGNRSLMTRSSIEEVVLETVYQLMGRPAPAKLDDNPYPGYPWRGSVPIAGWMLFALLPAAIVLAWFAVRYRRPVRSRA